MTTAPQQVLSLRARLTLIILCPLLVIAALVGFWAYRDAHLAERAVLRFQFNDPFPEPSVSILSKGH